MIRVDLEQFVDRAIFGPLNTRSSRDEIVKILGEPETYPGIVQYGHVAFDLASGIGPPCRIQIAFPHPSHMRPANPGWENWRAPTYFDNWPYQKFEWELGRLIPGLNIDDAIIEFTEFEEIEMISACNGLRMLHNPNSRVELCFENDKNAGQPTMTSIIAHPEPVAA